MVARSGRWRSRHWTAVLLLALGAALLSAAARPPPAEVMVPAVGCPRFVGNGGGLEPSTEDGPAVEVAIDARTAQRLAWYHGETGGVLAPRGWHCGNFSGTGGWSIIVVPQPFKMPRRPAPSGPAVELTDINGCCSGRFNVSSISQRFFARLMREFIQRIASEGPSGPAPTFPTDRITRVSDRLVEFTTPAGQLGLGTSAILVVGDDPILGFIYLVPTDGDPSIRELFVRLPADAQALATAIVQQRERCLQQGC